MESLRFQIERVSGAYDLLGHPACNKQIVGVQEFVDSAHKTIALHMVIDSHRSKAAQI
jgi:hypothetical protein